jgi:Ankyrin repeats (3 copies)
VAKQHGWCRLTAVTVLPASRLAALVNTRSAAGRTALELAAAAGSLSSVCVLLKYKADARMLNMHGEGCLHMALQQQHTKGSTDVTSIFDRLLEAIRAGPSSDDVTMQIVNSQRSDGCSALHLACEYGHLEAVRHLTLMRASIVQRNHSGRTALHIAVAHRHLAIARLLMQYHASVSIADERGQTALHILCQQADADVELAVAMLQHQDAHTTASVAPALVLAARDSAGWQPLHHAVACEHVVLVQWLLKCGAKSVDSVCQPGSNDPVPARFMNAVHIACYLGLPKMLGCLLDGGYALDQTGPMGRTALHYSVMGPLQLTEPWLFSTSALTAARVITPAAVRCTRMQSEIEDAAKPFLSCVHVCNRGSKYVNSAKDHLGVSTCACLCLYLFMCIVISTLRTVTPPDTKTNLWDFCDSQC